MSRVATPSQTVGPFFHLGAVPAARVDPVTGSPIDLAITVTDGDGRPVPDAMIEVWQTGCAPAGAGPEPVCGFGRLPTGAEGTCRFQTVRPAAFSRGDRQAAHINVCVFARGLLRPLHTRIYFPGDPGLSADAVLALVPEERRATLFATAGPGQADAWHFDIRLQGPGETVFFDV